MIDFTGKVALVTGASKGIGLATARLLAEGGASVMLTSRKIENLEAAAAEMVGDFDITPANAGDLKAAAECVAKTVARFGALDILINNAATSPYFGPLIDADPERFDKTFAVNVRGPLAWTQEAWRQIMARDGGSIVNIGSIGARSPNGPLGVYQASKAALEYLTQHLANELGPQVRINMVAAGLVKTGFSKALWGPTEGVDSYPWPLRRIGEPADVANAVAFLASDLSGWITGHVLVVDGGALISRKTP